MSSLCVRYPKSSLGNERPRESEDYQEDTPESQGCMRTNTRKARLCSVDIPSAVCRVTAVPKAEDVLMMRGVRETLGHRCSTWIAHGWGDLILAAWILWRAGSSDTQQNVLKFSPPRHPYTAPDPSFCCFGKYRQRTRYKRGCLKLAEYHHQGCHARFLSCTQTTTTFVMNCPIICRERIVLDCVDDASHVSILVPSRYCFDSHDGQQPFDTYRPDHL